LVAFAVGLFTLRDDGIDLCGCFENHCGGWIRIHLSSWTAISGLPMMHTFFLTLTPSPSTSFKSCFMQRRRRHRLVFYWARNGLLSLLEETSRTLASDSPNHVVKKYGHSPEIKLA
jgi:hypothetical protein